MPVDSETRRTVVASCASSDSTGFWEPGPELTAAEWSAYCTLVSRHVADADVVVFSGSLPRGWPESAYAQLIGLARAGGVPSILDTSGAAFRHGIAAGPQLAKPNAAELADLVNMAVDDVASAVVAIAAARELGARDLVVSLGPDGVVASVGFDETAGSSNPVGSSAVWVGSPPDRFAGTATGAGDAMVAALAVGVLRGDAWPDRLRRMIAWSAAAAAHPVAGEIDVELAARLAAVSTCELVERSA
jgi:tagatose 6-phosphate kinase